MIVHIPEDGRAEIPLGVVVYLSVRPRFPGRTVFVAVTNGSQRDWVQFGDVLFPPGASHVEQIGE